ncbi:hypothetical protein BH23THE1_BH23THE1_09840 [soil metagenome]
MVLWKVSILIKICCTVRLILFVLNYNPSSNIYFFRKLSIGANYARDLIKSVNILINKVYSYKKAD